MPDVVVGDNKGPTMVIFENIAPVCGVLFEPTASLSDSNPFEPEKSAITCARCAKPN